jgi:hypothetical protein
MGGFAPEHPSCPFNLKPAPKRGRLSNSGSSLSILHNSQRRDRPRALFWAIGPVVLVLFLVGVLVCRNKLNSGWGPFWLETPPSTAIWLRNAEDVGISRLMVFLTERKMVIDARNQERCNQVHIRIKSLPEFSLVRYLFLTYASYLSTDCRGLAREYSRV